MHELGECADVLAVMCESSSMGGLAEQLAEAQRVLDRLEEEGYRPMPHLISGEGEEFFKPFFELYRVVKRTRYSCGEGDERAALAELRRRLVTSFTTPILEDMWYLDHRDLLTAPPDGNGKLPAAPPKRKGKAKAGNGKQLKRLPHKAKPQALVKREGGGKARARPEEEEEEVVPVPDPDDASDDEVAGLTQGAFKTGGGGMSMLDASLQLPGTRHAPAGSRLF
jgi:hypothetical protein